MLPAGRQLHAGDRRNAADIVAGRIEGGEGPLQVQHFRRHDDAADVFGHRRQVLEVDADFGNALRHLDVESIDLDRVARPGQGLTRRVLEDESGHLDDLTVGFVVTRQPFRRQQYGVAGGHRNGFVDTEKAMRNVGGVDRDLQRAVIGNVPGGRQGRRRRRPHRLWGLLGKSRYGDEGQQAGSGGQGALEHLHSRMIRNNRCANQTQKRRLGNGKAVSAATIGIKLL